MRTGPSSSDEEGPVLQDIGGVALGAEESERGHWYCMIVRSLRFAIMLIIGSVRNIVLLIIGSVRCTVLLIIGSVRFIIALIVGSVCFRPWVLLRRWRWDGHLQGGTPFAKIRFVSSPPYVAMKS